jgi:hypothetical protein
MQVDMKLSNLLTLDRHNRMTTLKKSLIKSTRLVAPFLAVLVGTSAAASTPSVHMGSVAAATYVSTGAGANVAGDVLAGTYGTTGAGAIVGGDFRSVTIGTTGASTQIAGNFLSGGAGTTGASTIITGDFDAGGVITYGAGTTVSGLGTAPAGYMATMSTDLSAAINAMNTEKARLSNMGSGTGLAATMTINTTFAPGVYSAASWSTTAGTTITFDGGDPTTVHHWVFNITNILSTGASTDILMINAAPGSTVKWNVGGYASLGASSKFIGDIFATTYISVGASAIVNNVNNYSCGGLYSATSYVSIGAHAVIADGCGAGNIDHDHDDEHDQDYDYEPDHDYKHDNDIDHDHEWLSSQYGEV